MTKKEFSDLNRFNRDSNVVLQYFFTKFVFTLSWLYCVSGREPSEHCVDMTDFLQII